MRGHRSTAVVVTTGYVYQDRFVCVLCKGGGDWGKRLVAGKRQMCPPARWDMQGTTDYPA